MESNSECTCGVDKSCISYLMQLTDPASLSFNNAFASRRYLPIRIGKRHYLFELLKPKG